MGKKKGGWKRIDVPEDVLMGDDPMAGGLIMMEELTEFDDDLLMYMDNDERATLGKKGGKKKALAAVETAEADEAAPVGGKKGKKAAAKAAKAAGKKQAAATVHAQGSAAVVDLNEMDLEDGAAPAAGGKGVKRKKDADEDAGAEAKEAPRLDMSRKARKKREKQRRQREAKKGEAKATKSELAARKAAAKEAKAKEAAGALDMSAWDPFGLDERIVRGLAKLGFATPTEVQASILPLAILKGRDIVGAAKTGSGKTLAFGLPIIQHILAHCSEASDDEAETAPPAAKKAKASKKAAKKAAESESESEEDESGSGSEDEHASDASSSYSSDAPELPNRLKALIVAPTRELAVQIVNHLKAILSGMPGGNRLVQIAPLIGGIAVEKQERLLSYRPHIVVGTPGRLWEVMSEKPHPYLGQRHLMSLRFLVLDEADRMVESGHFREMRKMMDLMNAETDDHMLQTARRKRQTFLLSATMTLVKEKKKRKGKKAAREEEKKAKRKAIDEARGIVRAGEEELDGEEASVAAIMARLDFQRKVERVDLSGQVKIQQRVTETKIECLLEEKDHYLYYFLTQHTGRTLVFVNAITGVNRLTNILRLLRMQAWGIHSQMQQRQRLKNLDRFQAGDTAILVATDVAARGLDIPNVKYVVHYQVPRTADVYIHRSGRTARGPRGLHQDLLVRAQGRRDGRLSHRHDAPQARPPPRQPGAPRGQGALGVQQGQE